MIEQLKAMQLDDLADTARAIVEDGQDNDDFNDISAQRLKKLKVRSTLPRDKRYQVTKVKAFKNAISEFGK